VRRGVIVVLIGCLERSLHRYTISGVLRVVIVEYLTCGDGGRVNPGTTLCPSHGETLNPIRVITMFTNDDLMVVWDAACEGLIAPLRQPSFVWAI